MIFVGIDVAKDKHDCFIVNSDGEALYDVFTIQNNMDGFEDLFFKIKTSLFRRRMLRNYSYYTSPGRILQSGFYRGNWSEPSPTQGGRGRCPRPHGGCPRYSAHTTKKAGGPSHPGCLLKFYVLTTVCSPVPWSFSRGRGRQAPGCPACSAVPARWPQTAPPASPAYCRSPAGFP